MLTCDTCDKCVHSYCSKQSSLSLDHTRYKCTKCSVDIQKKQCTTCNQTFTALNLIKSSNETQCVECEQAASNSKLLKANCLVCGQYIHVVEQKKRIRQCTTCLKYVHVSCDKYYSSERLENYACFNCRDSTSLINPVLDKVAFFRF